MESKCTLYWNMYIRVCVFEMGKKCYEQPRNNAPQCQDQVERTPAPYERLESLLKCSIFLFPGISQTTKPNPNRKREFTSLRFCHE